MTTLAPPPSEELDARSYRRVHEGKLMLIDRGDARALSASDFFEFDSVGTHPTGLLVTGIFENDRRSHMRAGTVRDATSEEIAWRNAAQE